MRIRVLESCAGPHFDYPQGEHDVPDKIAFELINCGIAEPLEDVVEKATATPAPEVATTRGRGRGRRQRAKPAGE